MLRNFTEQRGLSELEHYRLRPSIGVATIVFFGMMSLVAIGICGVSRAISLRYLREDTSALFALILMLFFMGLWESHAFKAIKFWQAASPINGAELQRRIDDLQQALTQSMAKRFGWSAKP
jgi:hypothetical protein